MKAKDIKKAFFEKIAYELNLFRRKMLEQGVEKVYDNAFEIDSMVSIYELLVDKGESLGVVTIMKLLVIPDLLNYIFKKWINTEDTTMEELEACMDQIVLSLSKEKTIGGNLLEALGLN